jgi:hypothetical protein
VKKEEPKLDTCQITRVVVKPHEWTYEEKFKFVAEAISPTGKYNAFESVVLTHNVQYPVEQTKYSHYVDEIVNLLLQDGWDATDTRGDNWWNYRFRRNWNPSRAKWEECDIETNLMHSGILEPLKFVAYARGKISEKGKPKAIIESPSIPNANRLKKDKSKTPKEMIDAHQSFVERLHKDGWELTEFTGGVWWHLRFRRQVKQESEDARLQTRTPTTPRTRFFSISVGVVGSHLRFAWRVGRGRRAMANEEIGEDSRDSRIIF